MNQEVFGLRYEFVYQHGHHMALFKENGLEVCELSSLQVRMLEANQVPRMLPLDILEVDSYCRLQYKLASKRMLSHVLKVEVFTIQQFAKLMYAIVCTLDECKNYMLNEMNFVLKDNFIFIGQDLADVYLTYVPLDMPHETDEIHPSINALLRKLSSHVQQEEQEQWLSWTSTHLAINSLSEYKEALLNLMDKPNVEQNKEPETQSDTSSFSLPEQSLPKPHWKRNAGVAAANFEPDLTPKSNPNLDPLPVMAHPSQLSVESKISGLSLAFVPIQQRLRWIITATVLVFAAFLWQLYFTSPSTSTLQLLAGVTLLMGDAAYVLTCKGRPVLRRETVQNGMPKMPNTNNTTPSSEAVIQSNTPTITSPSDMQTYYSNLSMHTTLLQPSNPNATVLLGNTPLQKTLGPRLEFSLDHVSKVVSIDREVFTIGRGDASSKIDYVLDVVGVSRIHAEIVRTNNGFQLRDAGSTNGTYLNDQLLVTYQAYPLKDGDIVRIIRQEMTFRQ